MDTQENNVLENNVPDNTAPDNTVPKKKNRKNILRFFTHSASVGQLVGKSILLLVIPYVYLILCGIIFDKLLKLYAMTTFIFFSFVGLYVIAAVMIVMAILRYVKANKKK